MENVFRVNNKQPSKFCTSKLESKKYMCTGTVFKSSKNSVKKESLKGSTEQKYKKTIRYN